jgi:flavodoxin
MKNLLLFFALLTLNIVTPGFAAENPKALIAYFSHSGNTRNVARQIHEAVGGDIFEIKTVKQYTKDFDSTVEEAREEQKNNSRPELAEKVANMDAYDIVFLGYPDWVGTMPMALFSFLEQYDFSGKTIVPFCTHGTSGLGASLSDIRKLSPKANIREALGIGRGDIRNAENITRAWLRSQGYVK